MDGVTVRIMREAVMEKSLTLEEYGSMLLDAAAGSYERMSDSLYEHADFTTKYQRAGRVELTLYRPGTDEFTSPTEREVVKGLPVVWGGVLRRGNYHELVLAGIELANHAAVLLEGEPKVMILGASFPDTIKAACVGRKVGEVVNVPMPALSELIIVSVREACEDDLKRFVNADSYISSWKDFAETGLIIEVERLPSEILKIT